MTVSLIPGATTLAELRRVHEGAAVALDPAARGPVEAAAALSDARRIRPQLTPAEMRRFVGSALDRLVTSSGF